MIDELHTTYALDLWRQLVDAIGHIILFSDPVPITFDSAYVDCDGKDVARLRILHGKIELGFFDAPHFEETNLYRNKRGLNAAHFANCNANTLFSN